MKIYSKGKSVIAKDSFLVTSGSPEISALNNYFYGRLNACTFLDPYLMPRDGAYVESFFTPTCTYYYPGPRDIAWMQKQDELYLHKLAAKDPNLFLQEMSSLDAKNSHHRNLCSATP